MTGATTRAADVRVALVRLALESGRDVRLVVTGASMWPRVRSGSHVRIVAGSAHLVGPGDLAAFVADDTLVVHRCTRRDGETVVFRGDARGVDDRPCRPDAVLGRVVVERAPRLRWWTIPRRSHVVAACRAMASRVRTWR